MSQDPQQTTPSSLRSRSCAAASPGQGSGGRPDDASGDASSG